MGALLSVLFVAFWLGCVPLAFSDSDVEKGKVLFTVCASCHGADASGNQALNAPALKGLQGWYVVRQLKNFRAGLRGSDPKDTYGMQMRPMALILADDQAVEDVAAYIESLSQ
ncbi:MAG TPA: c-type cytochrome [Porticoccus sp.]|nr:c-type cytochrome [Porticoccus sp.]